MGKTVHEIRDPLHAFIKYSNDERKIIDSRPFQRLRHIHQLAMSFLVYPGATHKRFEHSLGVMELAGRMFDIITHPDVINRPGIRDSIPELEEMHDPGKKAHWRTHIRFAALCHDLGHLPFSHAAEKELLPEGWSHERLTMQIIKSEEMKAIWDSITPPPKIDLIVKLALGPEKTLKREITSFSNWEAILSELITGDVFGADRIDYLLRDSHHTGVAYGKFDHYRLIDTLRILPPSPVNEEREESQEPMLGIEEGGLHSAESLLLARYFMFTQVYFHRVRRIYDIHLKDFLATWLPDGVFSTDEDVLLGITDNEVFNAMREMADKDSNAQRIMHRQHFKVLSEKYPGNPLDIHSIFELAREKFGNDAVREDLYIQKGGSFDFPVLRNDDQVGSSLSLSTVLQHIPPISVGYVFIDRSLLLEAKKWLNAILPTS